MLDDSKTTPTTDDAQLFDRKQLIKLAVEFGPLLVFFIGNSRYGIYTGTAAFMAATVISRASLEKIFERTWSLLLLRNMTFLACEWPAMRTLLQQ